MSVNSDVSGEEENFIIFGKVEKETAEDPLRVGDVKMEMSKSMI